MNKNGPNQIKKVASLPFFCFCLFVVVVVVVNGGWFHSPSILKWWLAPFLRVGLKWFEAMSMVGQTLYSMYGMVVLASK